VPTIKRFGSLVIKIYADDHHPPHFHIVSADVQVLVRISDLVVIEGSARRAKIAEALAWAHANRPLLESTWAQLNKRV
jgi:hypothetical protein